MVLSGWLSRASRFGDLFLWNNSFLNSSLKTSKKLDFDFIIKSKWCNGYSTLPNNQVINTLVKKSNILPKKRLPKKRKSLSEEMGNYRIVAFNTAEEFNLEPLSRALSKFTEFEASTFGSDFRNLVDVVHAKQKSLNETDNQDVFFFREGCVVLWNVPDCGVQKILDFLKEHEQNRFVDDLIESESDVMSYSYAENQEKTHIHKDNLRVSENGDVLLEKYAVSNAMALSVLLGTLEANLEQYIESMEAVTHDLKNGNQIKMSRNEVLQKTGYLFALRHNVNLNSDLLDTPDFYWDREELENLYLATFNYFCIAKRTKVINERINHCIELVELLSSHLNDKHHVRLEWMIIILIMVEVAFEVVHYLNRYLES